MARFILLLFLLGPLGSAYAQLEIKWEVLAPNLQYGEVQAQQNPEFGDGVVSILKIDPDRFEFELLSAKDHGSTRTADQWAKEHDLIAVVNAGMYRADHRTNLGFMQHYDKVNNPRLNKDNTLAAFNPKDSNLPGFQIIDLTCQNWEELKTQYHSFTQSIRMVDCKGKNRWSQQPRKWSMVVLGEDREGNCLFIFTRSPYSVHDFINLLKQLPIELKKAMYLEGGPEASFYLNYGDTRVQRFGSYETGFYESDGNNRYWPIPNVIGIKLK